MNWFKRKKREDRFRITGYPDNRITGIGQKPCVPDPRIPGSSSPGSPDRRMSFSYVIPVLLALRLRSVLAPSVVEGLALFTGFLMIYTAAVLSTPTTATQGDWSGGADAGASVELDIFLTNTLDKRDNFIHKAWYS